MDRPIPSCNSSCRVHKKENLVEHLNGGLDNKNLFISLHV